MRRTTSVLTSAAIFIGAGCSGDRQEIMDSSRNPLALNVVIEEQLVSYDELEGRSKESIAGLGLGIAEECVVMGISPTEIENVPRELMQGEFTEGYSLVFEKRLSQLAILAVCEEASAQIKQLV